MLRFSQRLLPACWKTFIRATNEGISESSFPIAARGAGGSNANRSAFDVFYWKPGWALTLPLGLVYSVGLYALTLKPLARLLQRREHLIWEAVMAKDVMRDS